MRFLYLFLKRLFDMGCALLGLAVSAPLWLIIALGIELSDPGPVFYIAHRTTKHNRVFDMYKFRSMRQGKANESVFRGEEDRIFPFGRLIRATKLDELPQLINILIGDMSIVGPRPAAVDQVEITRGGRFAAAGEVTSGLTHPRRPLCRGRRGDLGSDGAVGTVRLPLRRPDRVGGGVRARRAADTPGAGPCVPRQARRVL